MRSSLGRSCPTPSDTPLNHPLNWSLGCRSGRFPWRSALPSVAWVPHFGAEADGPRYFGMIAQYVLIYAILRF